MTRRQIWIIAVAGLAFALIFGVRQSVALFIGPINTATGLGIASISEHGSGGDVEAGAVAGAGARRRPT